MDRVLYDNDEFYRSVYRKGMAKTATPSSNYRMSRFYNLVQLISLTTGLDGFVAECGCWYGLSSFLLCNYIGRLDSKFNGDGYLIVDSFEGLSAPSDQDGTKAKSGMFCGSVKKLKDTLKEFPLVDIHQGWVPEILESLPEKKYRFVHVDLDLYGPSLGCLEYFYPRMVDHGVIVLDDYGMLNWPGVKKAVDYYCKKENALMACNVTGQAFIIKRV